MEETTRLFVALRPPAAVRAELRETQSTLAGELRGKIRWTRDEQLHLTLFFCAAFPAGEVEALANAFAILCARERSHRIEFRAPEARPARRSPKVLWLPARDDLVGLHRALAQAAHALEPEACPLPERPFRPHLTLARFPRGGPRGLTGAIHRALPGWTPPSPWLAEGAELLASRLDAGGATHTLVRALPFDEPGPSEKP